MAKAKKSKAKKSARRCPPCTEGVMARTSFTTALRAGRCDIADRALTKIKQEVGAKADHMTPGAKALAFRDLLQKQAKVDHCESRESARFNGLGSFGSR